MLFVLSGFIKLRSKRPFDPPLIYPNYFQDDFDMKTLIEGAKIGVALSQTPALKSYGSRLHEFPDCAHIPRYTDPYWECMIRLYTVTIYHPVGEYKCTEISGNGLFVNFVLVNLFSFTSLTILLSRTFLFAFCSRRERSSLIPSQFFFYENVSTPPF